MTRAVVCIALLLSACGGGTDAVIEGDGLAVTPGFFIGKTASNGNLSIAVSSIRSIFFVCGEDNVFHRFSPPLTIAADGTFSGEFEHRGQRITVNGNVVNDDLITGAIDGDARCQGTFTARRCNSGTQNCNDSDGDTIPDEVDPNVDQPQPTTTATFTPGGTQRTPTPVPTITFTPGGNQPTVTPTPSATFTQGGGQPTPTATLSETPTPTVTSTIPGGTEIPTPSPTATCSLAVTVTLGFPVLQQGRVVNGVVVTVDYPATASIPPAGDGQRVDARVTNLTGVSGGEFIPVDSDSTTSLRITFAPGFEPNPGPTPPASRPVQIPGGPFARILFDCQGTPPSANSFPCSADASDGNGDFVAGTTCTPS